VVRPAPDRGRTKRSIFHALSATSVNASPPIVVRMRPSGATKSWALWIQSRGAKVARLMAARTTPLSKDSRRVFSTLRFSRSSVLHICWAKAIFLLIGSTRRKRSALQRRGGAGSLTKMLF